MTDPSRRAALDLPAMAGRVRAPSAPPRGRGAWLARVDVRDWLAWASASNARAALVLVLLSLAAFLPGFASLPPMDRDEPRFAQATKQMLETGDFVDIRFQDEARHKKPVGIYWLQAASVTAGEALGVDGARATIALYRLPSLLAAVGVVLATFWAALPLVSRPAALLAGAFMAGTILLGVEARLAKTDAVLTFLSVIAMGGLARAYALATGDLDGRLAPDAEAQTAAPPDLLFWTAIGLGVLVKGPLILMFVGLAAAALSVHRRSAAWLLRLRPWRGALVVALLVLPWLAAIGWRSGGSFFADSLGRDMLGKVAEGQEKHWGPPGLYAALFWVTAWPLAPLALLALPAVWRERWRPATLFALAWIAPSWIVFEAVSTKLPHYVLPLLPAVAILVAGALVREVEARGRAMRWAASGLLLIVPVALLGVAVFGGLRFEGLPLFASLPGLFLSAIAAGLAVALLRKRGAAAASGAALAAALLAFASVYAFAFPALRSLALSPRLAEAVRDVGCANPRVATAGYREPSLVFLVGTELHMTDGAGAARFLAEPGCRVALVSNREEAAYRTAAAVAGVTPRLVTRVRGFNINGGREIDVAVLARD